jgi:DNA invertase Pin-like site-specific DNA recombinase
MKSRVVLYVRVSTDEQAEEGYSIDEQLRICREFCERQQWEIVNEFVDPGESGTTTQRPAFQQMLYAARAQRFEIVVVHKIDRFSRSLLDALMTLGTLSKHGVGLRSVTEDFDFASPFGRIVLAILVAFAQYFIDNLRAETKKGLKGRALKGYVNGTLPFGYKRVPKEQGGVPVIDKKNIRGYYKAQRLCLKGKNNREIADTLNAQGFRTTGNRGSNLFMDDNIADMLRSRFYLGLVSYKGVWHQGKHQAATDEVTWEKVQAALRQRSSHRDTANQNVRTYPFRKLAYCALCGSMLRGQPSNKGVRKYRDMESVAHRCQGPQTMDAQNIEMQVGTLLSNIVLPADWRNKILGKVQTGMSEQEKEKTRRRLQAELARARKLYIKGDSPDDEYEKEKRRIELQLDQIRPVAKTEYDSAAVTLASAGALWAKATDIQRMELARVMFQKIYINSGTVSAIEPQLSFYPLMALAVQKITPPTEIDGVAPERAYGSDGRLNLMRAPIIILAPGSIRTNDNQASLSAH